jgi:hypothetical protein
MIRMSIGWGWVALEEAAAVEEVEWDGMTGRGLDQPRRVLDPVCRRIHSAHRCSPVVALSCIRASASSSVRSSCAS